MKRKRFGCKISIVRKATLIRTTNAVSMYGCSVFPRYVKVSIPVHLEDKQETKHSSFVHGDENQCKKNDFVLLNV